VGLLSGERDPVAKGSAETTFRVSAEVRHVYGGGKLTIGPRAIVLECSRPTRAFSGVAQVVHTDRDVLLVKARLVPPWYNTSLVLHSLEGSACAITGALRRRQLRESLTAAAFNVREVSTLLSLHGDGRTQLAPHERERPRWLTGRTRASLAVASLAAAALCVVLVSHAAWFVGVVIAGVLLNFVALFR